MNQGSNQLFNKYIDGSLTEDDRFELEKRALDDAFVSDALEGVELHQKSDKKKVGLWMQQLQLHGQTKAKVVSMFSKNIYRYAVAASLAIVVAAFLLLRPDSKELVDEAMAVEIYKVQDDSPIADTPIAIMPSGSIDASERNEPKQRQEVKAPSKRKVASVQKEKVPVAAQQELSLEEVAVNSISDIAIADQSTPEISFNGRLKSSKEAQTFTINSEEKEGQAIRSTIDFDAVSLSQSEKKINDQQPETISTSSNRAISGAALKKKANGINRDQVYPLIGYDELDKRAKAIGISPEYAFMRKIKLPLSITVEFRIDKNGEVSITKPLDQHPLSPQQKAIDLIKNSGKWKAPEANFLAQYVVIIQP